jgi:putative membrane protein
VIIRDKPGLPQLLFAVRGSVLPHIVVPLLLLFAFSAALVAVDRWITPVPRSEATPFSVLGVGLSLFLGFRNNAAYDRWWEARKLWGGLIADLRALAREAELFLGADDRHRLLRLSLAFAHHLRCQLRRQQPDAATLVWEDAPAGRADAAGAALDSMGGLLAEAKASGRIDGFGSLALSDRLASLARAQTNCEGILTTPLPYAYSLLIFRSVYLYCLLLPLAMIGPEGWLTPVFTGFVAYAFLGLAEVTEDLAHPFSASLNAIPLDALCRVMEISLAPHLDIAAPPPLDPRDFHLN